MSGISLEPMTIAKHLSSFHAMASDPQTMHWSAQSVRADEGESEEWMATTLPSASNPNIEKMAIMLPGADMVGFVGTNRPSPQGIEMGYCLNRAYWGRGIAGEAVRKFLAWYWQLEQRKDVAWLVAKVDPENVASERIMRRIGARRGELLQEYILLGRDRETGKKRDVVCWYLDRPET